MEGTKDTSPPTEIDFAHRTVSGAMATLLHPRCRSPLAAPLGWLEISERRERGFG